MRKLHFMVLVFVCAFTDLASAITISVDRETYPTALEFTVDWEPSPRQWAPVTIQEPINYGWAFTIEANNYPLYWSNPPPSPFVNVELFLFRLPPPGVLQEFFVIGHYTVHLIFPPGSEPLFELATAQVSTFHDLPNPAITAAANGYGAHFLFQNFPIDVSDNGSSSASLGLAIAGCLGLRKRLAKRGLPG